VLVRITTEKVRTGDGRYDEDREEKKRSLDREPRVDLTFAGGFGNPIPNPILSNTKLKPITLSLLSPEDCRVKKKQCQCFPAAHPSRESS
jgi:hypothetical protein